MRKLGAIQLLQVQLEPLKRAEGSHRRYGTEALRRVDAFRLEPAGVVAELDGHPVLDVHHAGHPRTRQNQGLNALSLGFTSHYRAMRERFGAHLVDGAAGESLVVACEDPVTLGDLAGRVEIRSAAGSAVLTRLRVAEPCEPFATWALGREPGEADPQELKAGLQFLREGRRGFYATWEGPGDLLVALGDEIWVG